MLKLLVEKKEKGNAAFLEVCHPTVLAIHILYRIPKKTKQTYKHKDSRYRFKQSTGEFHHPLSQSDDSQDLVLACSLFPERR